MTQDLPQGFVLEDPGTPAPSAPPQAQGVPPGFVLETPAPAPTAADMMLDPNMQLAPAPPGAGYQGMTGGPAVQQAPSGPVEDWMATGGDLIHEGKAAGPGTQAVGSLPTEIGARVGYFARQRFPNLPEQEAVQRYGMRDGRLFYVDDDRKAYYEESEARLPESLADIPAAAQETGKAVAGSAGPALPVITGTAAGIVTAPMGAGIPGAAAGGAVGDAARQALAGAFTGEEKSIIDRVMQTGGAALQEGAGQAGGVLIGRGVSRFGRTPTYDIPATSELGEKAGKFDVPLTAGERTGSRELIRRQKILAGTMESDEIFENFYRMRNDRVREATYELLRKISPESSVRGASKMGVEGAQAAADIERRALAAQAKPLYEQAYTVDTVNTQPVLDLINSKIEVVSAPVRAKLTRIKNDLLMEVGDGRVAENRLAKIDDIKKWLDGEISAAGRLDRSLGKSQKFHLEDVRKALLQQADEADQAATGGAYAKARGIYEEGLPASTELTKGVVGDVAKLEANDVLKATRVLFNPRTSSVEDVALARGAFEKAGKQAEWNALVRAHLQDAFEAIPENAYGDVTNLGGTFFRAVYKNPKAAGMLHEALKGSPGAARDIRWFMEVMQATGRAAKGESITAFAQAGQRQLAKEAKPIGASVIETVEVWKSPSRLARWWADVAEGRYARKMAELLTTPDGIAKLKELRKLSPTSAGAVIGVTHLLTAAGVAQASEAVTPDVQPGDFSSAPQGQP